MFLPYRHSSTSTLYFIQTLLNVQRERARVGYPPYHCHLLFVFLGAVLANLAEADDATSAGPRRTTHAHAVRKLYGKNKRGNVSRQNLQGEINCWT
jgi:hypothetical protein